MQFQIHDIPIQEIQLNFPDGIRLFIKREDTIHSFVSGNKYRKLQLNLKEARKQKHQTLLTFGGAFSNHIAAVAAAGKMEDFSTIGIIRGEELENKIASNPTLKFAHDCGMQFKFVSREEYRLKHTASLLEQLTVGFGRFYHIPEGGTNALAIKGCEAIISEKEKDFDIICCAVGTGGTISGISKAAFEHQTVLGFPALKSDFLTEEVAQLTDRKNWQLMTEYHFGGYAKTNETLIRFINHFKGKTSIPLDPIYTGKMLFGIIDMIKKGYFEKQKRILAIHTGGLQGIKGMNIQLQQKGRTLLQ